MSGADADASGRLTVVLEIEERNRVRPRMEDDVACDSVPMSGTGDLHSRSVRMGLPERPGWAVLAAGALVASLLAVGASPAAAVDKTSKANNKAETSACVGPAMADAGFEDTTGLGAEAAINCLAYYGITTGKTATTFDPGSNVTREQMALFLYRAAGVAGIDLSKGNMAASFGDLGEVGAERQTAIAALARNGILNGRSSMSFVPTADITRAEMAVALINLLTKVPGSGVAKNVAKNDGTYVLTPDVTGDDFDTFADSFASVSAPVDSAVSAAYEMGITTGYGDYTFRPNNPVPRKNMASFITRALAHTNARPAGLTAQAVSAGVRVSVRDANFAPIANQEVDAFKIDDISQAAKAFKSDGTCSAAFGAAVDSATTKCEIDLVDPVTNSQGNVDFSVTANAKGTVVWVWTGQLGTKLTAGTDLYEVELKPGSGTAAAREVALVSTTFPNPEALDGENATDNLFRAKFGSSVTINIQLRGDQDLNSDGDTDDAGENRTADAKPDTAGDSYKVTITYPTGAVDVKTYATDSDGSASFTLSAADPDPRTKGQTSTVTWRIDVVESTVGASPSTASPQLVLASDLTTGADSRTGDVKFSDAASALHSLKAEPVNRYWPAATSDNPTTGNALTATATDQYGDGMGDVCVKASTSVDSGSTFPTASRRTFSDGKVRISWRFTSTDAAIETVTVEADADCGDTFANDITPAPTASVYWTKPGAATDDGGALLTANVGSNTLILNEGANDPTVFVYDANDQFNVSGTPATMADFEKKLTEVLGTAATADDGSVAVSNYKPGDSSNVASFSWS